MTKLPGGCVTPGHGGAATTTLINRSGQCYQLHRPHLALQAERAGPEPPLKRLKAAQDGCSTPLSAKQQQQRQQALATQQLLRARGPERSPAHRGRPSANPEEPGCGGDEPHGPEGPAARLLAGGKLRHRQRASALASQSPPQPASSTHVSQLYPEILAQVFSNLDVRDRGRAAQVCVAWREAAYQRSAWRGVQARLHLRKHSSQVFQCLERRGIRRVQVLSVTTRRSSLGDVFRGIPRLQSLNLSGCYHMSDSSLNQAIATSYPHLTELDLSLCKNLTDASLGKISQYLGNLEVLLLGGCSNVTNGGLQLVAWGLKNLRRLDLRSCWLISDQGIGYLAGLGAGGEPQPAGGCRSLEELVLQDCQRVSDEALRHLALGLPGSLASINLSFCVLITDSGMKHVAKIASLRELNLRSCDNISEIGIAYLAEGGSRISCLDVSFCDKIGDQALQHISQGLFNLKRLSMTACPISDEGICRIAKTQQELETLYIGQCSKLTDRGVQSLLDHMHQLRCIDLYGCTKISKQALGRIEVKSPPISLIRELWQERR